jgi:hypothetical protein
MKKAFAVAAILAAVGIASAQAVKTLYRTSILGAHSIGVSCTDGTTPTTRNVKNLAIIVSCDE